MLIEVSSRICFHHVAKCFQDDSQIQDQMLWHLQCRHCIIWIWSVFLPSEVSATDQRMRQSVAESLSLSQNKRLLLYQTLWECLMCHYSNIYPLLPMNLSTDLSIRRQRNPLCPKIFLFLVELDMCRVGVASSFKILTQRRLTISRRRRTRFLFKSERQTPPVPGQTAASYCC